MDTNDLDALAILQDMGIADVSLFNNELYITRNDCVALILRAIGTKDDVYDESYSGTELFSDGDEVNYMEFINEYVSKCIFTSGTNYVGLARKYTNIICGENGSETSQTKPKIYFNFTRPVTAMEAVAFMVRCLFQPTIELCDLNQTFHSGLEIGLVNISDSFYDTPEDPISCSDFFILLNRFLHQPKYLYFNESSYKFNINTTDDHTYFNLLSNRN